ncbi:MAG: Txe/YoeB family addiction module toxin [Candidatus Kapaibacterium sp.]|nr:MAG: Txe/YoeB family addiction module toxin [Candidatus Kapabacteria bacterium]
MTRRVTLEPKALKELQDLFALDRKTAQRCLRILTECSRTPFEGIGKPEPLKGSLSGFWSRRINDADRIVYEVTATEIVVHSLKGHYE